MDDFWLILVALVVAVPVFLLLRWLAVRRAVTQAQRRRDQKR